MCPEGRVSSLTNRIQSNPGWTSHGPMARNARVMSGAICHADTHYPAR